MADDLSFTISAKDQASKAVETVQKKIQGFGQDVAKMALGVAGPMALLQAGFGFVSGKIDEYNQRLEDAKKLNLELADAAAKAGKAMTPGQEFSFKKATEEKTAAEKANIDIKNNEYANAVINENDKRALDDYIEYRKKSKKELTKEETDFLKENISGRNDGSVTSIITDKYIVEIKKMIIERRQAELDAENDILQKKLQNEKKVQEVKQKTVDIAKIEAETKALNRETETGVNGKYTQEQVSQNLLDKIFSLQLSRKDASTEERATIDNQIAKARQEKARVDADIETKAQDAAAKLAAENAKKDTKPDIKEKVALTVSSLREIGGSFGGDAAYSSTVDVAKDQLDVLKQIATNTSATGNSPVPNPGDIADSMVGEPIG